MKNKLNIITEIILGAIIFLLPLFLFPLLTDIFEAGKFYFLGFSVFVGFILYSIKSIREKKVIIAKPLFIAPLAGLFVVSLISCIFNTPYIIQSLSSLSGAITILFLIFFYLFLKVLVKTETIIFSLMAGGLVLGIISIVLSAGILPLPLTFPSFNLTVSEIFSPLGSILSQTIWLSCLVPLGIALAYQKLSQKKNLQAIFLFIAVIFCLAGIGFSLNKLTSTAKPIILSKNISWNIAMETLKNPRLAFIGVGPGQYINSFTSFKPVSFNSSPYWEYRFGTASWFFQLLTELGIGGFIVILFLIWRVLKNIVKVIRQKNPSVIALAGGLSLVILFVSQYYIPMNISLLFLMFVLLSVFEIYAGYDEKIDYDLTNLGGAVYLFLIFPAVFWALTLFFGTKSVLANNYYLNSLKAAAAGNGTLAYELQIKTIQTEPKVSTYHIAYSNTNLALANTLASKQDLNDNDRNAISQLVQQAIREAKTAVSLEPNFVYGWENLAVLYKNLINLAQDADAWAIASYQEAIKLDPANPKLRLDLGGIYYSKKNFNQAASLFNQAVSLKQDYANAHYNLASSLKELGALQEAKNEYEITLSLVAINSDDYQKVMAEIEDIKNRLPAPTPAAGELEPETLSTPEVSDKKITPPLDLENEPLPALPENKNSTPTEGPEEIDPTVQPQP